MDELRPETLEHVARAASLAPDLHPGAAPVITVVGGALAVVLPSADVLAPLPLLVLAAGVSLLYGRVAARGLGLDSWWEAFPDAEGPGIAARLHLAAGAPPEPREVELADQVVDRFDVSVGGAAVAVLPEVLTALENAAAREGAQLRTVPPPQADDAVAPLLAVVTTHGDDRWSWLSAGCALGAVLLSAGTFGVRAEAVPLPDQALLQGAVEDDAVPQAAVRLTQHRMRLTTRGRAARRSVDRLPILTSGAMLGA